MMSPSDLFINAAKEGIYEYFKKVAMGQQKRVAIRGGMRKFDEYWITNQDKTIETQSDMFHMYEGDMMVGKINSIHDPKLDEIVGVKFPLELALSPKLILTDTVDILIIRRYKGGNARTVIRGISLEDSHPYDNKRYVAMKTAMFRYSVQRYLGGSQIKRNYEYEFRPLKGIDRCIELEPFDIPTMFQIVKNVSLGIDNEIYYPTMSKEVCRGCVFNRTCNLTLVRD